MASNTLEFLLKFLVDKKSQADAQKAVQQMEQAGQRAGGQFFGRDSLEVGKATAEYAKTFGMSIEEAAGAMQGMAIAGQKTEQQILADAQAFQRMESEANQTAAAVDNIDRNVQKAGKTIRLAQLGMTGFGVMMSGMALQKFGKALLSPIEQYTKYSGMTSGASAEWLTATQRVEQSVVRIGAVLSQTVAPVISKIADTAEKAAKFIEDHPQVASGIALLAGGSMVIGGLMIAAGQIMSGIGAFASLGNLMGLGAGASAGAAGAGGWLAGAGASIGPIVAAVLPFVLTTAVIGAVATFVYSQIAKTEFGQSRNMQDAPGQYASLVARNVGNLIGGQELGDKWFMAIARLTGVVEDLGEAADETATALGPSAAAVDAYIAYRKQEVAAEEQYSKERSAIVEQYAKQRADIEESYEQRRADLRREYAQQQAESSESLRRSQSTAARDLGRNEGRSEEDYYQRRMKLAEQYNRDVVRAEEDHQRRMLELRREHDDRAADLADKRDALGLFREMRDYERERQEAESEYEIQASRRNQDFALRMSEMETEFSQARARRMADYAQRRADEEAEYQYRQAKAKEQLTQSLKELDESHKAELLALDKQRAQKLAELDRSYTEERNRRRTAFADQIRDLDAALLGERNRRVQWYQAMSQDLDAWIKAWTGRLDTANPSPTTRGSRAIGGYVWSGLWQMHDDEFVMNANTTRLAERLAGGRLDQGGLIRLMLQGAQTQTSVTLNDHRRFDSRLSAEDRRQIQRDTALTLAGALNG